jgi:2'-5' RNA ligase
LPLPDTRREELERYVAACAVAAPEFRWAPASNLHLTIRFLGHVELSIAEGIADQLADLDLEGFELRMGEAGAFKRGRLARVVWLGLASGASEIGVLAEAVEAACVGAGLEAESRRFHVHLTLARSRARDGAVLPALPPPPELGAWRADGLILYRSHLGRGGSVYEPLRTVRLS